MFDFSPDAGLWGLAASAFLSATILPGNSEIVLLGVLAKYPSLFWQCIVVATIAVGTVPVGAVAVNTALVLREDRQLQMFRVVMGLRQRFALRNRIGDRRT